jgi:hypothetical protein
MEQRRAGMYPPVYAQQAPPPGGYYAPPPGYGHVIHHRVEGAQAAPPGYGNPYISHDPNCRYYGDERRRKNSIATALAAVFVVCWCCTWPCHGPCCCGL